MAGRPPKTVYKVTDEGETVTTFKSVIELLEKENITSSMFYRYKKSGKPIKGFYYDYSEEDITNRLRAEFYI